MSLDPKAARLARVSVAISIGDWSALARLRAEAPAGEPDRAWREAVLQSHLFAGFPRLVEAYEVIERAGGLGLLDADEVRREGDMSERGRELFDRIYAGDSAAVLARLESYHPDFAAWIAGHAYGRVLARPGLDARVRELCAVACLAALGQERQLASHARGALHCGATRAELDELLAEIGKLMPSERVRSARAVMERFLD